MTHASDIRLPSTSGWRTYYPGDSRFVLVIGNYCVTSATTIVRRCYLNDLLLPWRIARGIQSDKKNVDEAESLLNIASRVIGEFRFEHFFIDREYYTHTYADCRKLKNSRVFYRVFNHFSPYYARNSQFCSYVVYHSDSLIIFLSLSVSRRSLNGGKRKGGKEDNGWNSDFV